MIERLGRDFLVPLRLTKVRGLHQEARLDWAHLRLIDALANFVARARRPREVVNVVAVIGVGAGVVWIILLVDLHSAGADDLVLRHRELYVVDAEVGEEFRHGVILMAVPGSVPPYAHFREPLAAQHEVTLPS